MKLCDIIIHGIGDGIAICIPNMYLWHLSRLATKTFDVLYIELVDKKKPDIRARSYTTHLLFDLKAYLKLATYEKKKKVLDIVHNSLMTLSAQEDINQQQLINAYNKCLARNLEHRFLFRGNKHLRSPNHQYFGNVVCFWDVDIFIATAIIYNRQGEEIMRKIIGIEDSGWAGFIYYTKLKWENGYFCLRGKHWFELEYRTWCMKVYTPPLNKQKPPTIQTWRRRGKLPYGWSTPSFCGWIYISFDNPLISDPEYIQIRNYAECVANMYIHQLGPLKGYFRAFYIILKNKEDFDSTLTSQQAKDRQRGVATSTHIDLYIEPRLKSPNLTIHTPFNFKQWYEATPYDKKKMLLDTIHKCLSAISEKERIDPQTLEKAYQACLANKLTFRFPFEIEKKRTLRSPNNKYLARVECLWEIDTLTVTAIIQDKAGTEIMRQIMGKQQANEAEFPLFIFRRSEMKWEEGYFFLKTGKNWTKEDHGILTWSVKVYTPKPKKNANRKSK